MVMLSLAWISGASGVMNVVGSDHEEIQRNHQNGFRWMEKPRTTSGFTREHEDGFQDAQMSLKKEGESGGVGNM